MRFAYCALRLGGRGVQLPEGIVPAPRDAARWVDIWDMAQCALLIAPYAWADVGCNYRRALHRNRGEASRRIDAWDMAQCALLIAPYAWADVGCNYRRALRRDRGRRHGGLMLGLWRNALCLLRPTESWLILGVGQHG